MVRAGVAGARRVPAERPGRGGAALGPAQAEAQHELRQAVARAAVLLRQEYHEQGVSVLFISNPACIRPTVMLGTSLLAKRA